MGCVDDNSINTRINQRLHAVEGVGSDAHASRHAQAAFLVFAGHGLVLGLGDVLIGNQAHKAVILIHHRQFLNLMLLQYFGSGGKVGLLMGSHQILARHHIVNFALQPALKAQVAIRNDAHQVVLVIYHWNTTDVILSHHGQRVGHGLATANGHGVVNHAVLSTLYNGHLAGLCLDGHILVNHTNATFAGNGNGHSRLRHRVHSSGHERYVQLNVPRKAGFQLYRFGQYL